MVEFRITWNWYFSFNQIWIDMLRKLGPRLLVLGIEVEIKKNLETPMTLPKP